MFNINNLKIRTKLLLTLLIGFKASAGIVPDPRKVIPLDDKDSSILSTF